MLFYLVSFFPFLHFLFYCFEFFSSYFLCLSSCVCCFAYVEEGRFPKYEVRKRNQALEDGTTQRDSLVHDLYDNETASVAEDYLLKSDVGPAHNDLSSKTSQSMEESSFEDEESLRLFLYGVRYHSSAIFWQNKFDFY